MKTSTLMLVVLFLATAVMAQSEEAVQADYSRDTLVRILSTNVEREPVEPRVRFRVGAVDFRALGTSWRFNYLPMMTPLSGSIMRTSYDLPDPFSHTGTSIASPPRVWRQQRAMNAELRRIEKLDRKRAKVVVNP